MAKSQNDLASAVLRQIGVLGAEETADANDVALVQTAYATKHGEWTERGYVDWPNSANPATSEIPDEVFQIVINLVANEVLPAFGFPLPEETRAQREQLLLVGLRRLVAGTEDTDYCGPRTKKQLSTAVLRRLSIIDPLAEPSNKDAAFVWSAYDAVYARLSARDMTYWKNGGKDEQLIPNEVFLDIVRIVASDLAPIFGASMEAEMDENGSMLAPGVLGMKNLRRIIGRSATDLPTRAEYF